MTESEKWHKVNPPGDTLLLRNSPDGIARQSPTYAGEGALGQKACLCVDTRRQVQGHEARISTLERQVA